MVLTDEVSVTCTVGSAGESDSPIPTDEEESTSEDVERNFDDDRGEDESRPVVHPRGLLTSSVELTKTEVLGLKLLSERSGENDSHENGEKTVLKTRGVVW